MGSAPPASRGLTQIPTSSKRFLGAKDLSLSLSDPWAVRRDPSLSPLEGVSGLEERVLDAPTKLRQEEPGSRIDSPHFSLRLSDPSPDGFDPIWEVAWPALPHPPGNVQGSEIHILIFHIMLLRQDS